ncbi:MAG TPA: hypothetical protein VJX67_23795 [Blastocatellia bacterium]|nr:hypothetical protein [Blastocatellia bacterium]
MMARDHSIQRPEALKAHPPNAGRIDLAQCRTLIGIYLRQGFRPVPTSSRRQRRPLVTLVVGMLLFGTAFSAGRSVATDLDTYLTALMTAVFALVMMGAVPDSALIRERYLEILYSKPIDERTMLAAQIATRLIYAWVLSSAFATVPLLACEARFSIYWPALTATYFMMVIGGFSSVAIWISSVNYLTRWLSLEKFRAAVRYLNIAVLLACYLPAILVWTSGATGGLTRSYSISSVPLLKVLPSFWFATFFTSGRGADHLLLARIGALAFVMAAVLTSWRPKSAKRYPEMIERMMAADNVSSGLPFSIRLLGGLKRIPVLGHLLVSDQAFGVALLILTCTGREDSSRTRVFAQRIAMAAVFAVCLYHPSSVWVLWVTFYGFNSIKDGVQIISQSSDREASWIFRASPVESAQVIKGIRFSVFFGFLLVPAAFSCFLFYFAYGALAGTLLCASFLLEAAIATSLFLIASPSLPLSQEVNVRGAYINLLVSTLFGMAGLVPISIILFVIRESKAAGTVVAGVLIAVMLAVHIVLTFWAKSRLGGVECEV